MPSHSLLQQKSSVPLLLTAAVLVVGVGITADELGIVFDPHKHVIWLGTRIADRSPLTFAFDSAAARSAIDWDRAKELNIPVTELGEQYAGSGDKRTRVGRTESINVAIRGVVIALRMGVVSLRGVSETYGRRMDGVIGADVLARYVTEIDWQTSRMTFYEPETYRYSGKGTEVPLIIAGGMPFVRMSVSVPGAPSREGIFLVDYPHPGTIIMNTPFVEEGLLAAAQRNLPRMIAYNAEGVGGKSQILQGRIAEIQLGPYSLHKPLAGFSQARNGSLARSEFAGILGAEILRRFKVILDFSRTRMILEPNAALAEPFRADASGLQLRSSGPDYHEFTVAEVVEDSPAARAKMQAGDQLIEIDGRPANAVTLGELQDLLKGDGNTVRLRVRRGNQSIDISLPLRSLL